MPQITETAVPLNTAETGRKIHLVFLTKIGIAIVCVGSIWFFDTLAQALFAITKTDIEKADWWLVGRWGLMAIVVIFILTTGYIVGRTYGLWSFPKLRKERLGKTRYSEGGQVGGTSSLFSSLFGVLAACLLLAATYSCFQAGARHQAERGLLATQGWREPQREQRLRVIESETVVILEPGQISAPIKVEGTQAVSFYPSTIPNSDVKKLFYFPYNGGYNIVTNRLGDKTTHSVGYEMRLKSERVSGSVRIEVAVGRL